MDLIKYWTSSSDLSNFVHDSNNNEKLLSSKSELKNYQNSHHNALDYKKSPDKRYTIANKLTF